MVMKKDSRSQIRDFIVKNFMEGKGSIKDTESLFEANVIDSFGILELISFIEKDFGVSISPIEVTIANFDSVDKIVRMIEAKRK